MVRASKHTFRTVVFVAVLQGFFTLSGSKLMAASLDVGAVAPKLHITEWVQGEAIDLQKEIGKRAVMVEFWAVWCPPCKESIPRLTKIQTRYKNQLAIVGVTAPDSRGNTPTAVRKFVKDQGSGMNYWVAIDDRDQTTDAYLAAAGAMGIPHAFLVGKDGKIAWQGSPLDPDVENVIDGVIRGTYDAKTEAEVARKFQQLDGALGRRQWDVVSKGLADIVKIAPANELALRALRRVYLEEMNKADEYRSWARGHVSANRSNGRAMLVLGGVLMEVADFSQRMPDLALEATKAAYEASKPADPESTTLYAMALHQIGALDRAIVVQQEAVKAYEGEQRASAQAVLD